MGRLLICTAAFAAFVPSAETEVAAADAPVWHSDFSKAKEIARRSKRPLFVVFR